jgi:hypothetical protein
MSAVDWEDRLDDWELELELGARLDGSDWVTLEKAAAETGVSRAALRTWYRGGQIPSRLVDGPHGPQRLVPLAMVAERADLPRAYSTQKFRGEQSFRDHDPSQSPMARITATGVSPDLAKSRRTGGPPRRRDRARCSPSH